jgi:hypothetical protein
VKAAEGVLGRDLAIVPGRLGLDAGQADQREAQPSGSRKVSTVWPKRVTRSTSWPISRAVQ